MLPSCNMAAPNSYEDDPYGIVEAEEQGGQPARLIECSQNEKCPEYAEALFWLAVDILSKANAGTIEIEGKDLGLTSNMSIEEMTEKLGAQLEGLLNYDPPKYHGKILLSWECACI